MSNKWFFIYCVLLLVNISVGIQNGDMRLVEGKSSNEGRVEVYYNGQWGTICDDSWDIEEAKVVCRHLKFDGAVSAVVGGVYGPGPGPIWMDDLNCKGTEKDLATCQFKGWGISDCNHGEDAGVICEKALPQNITREYSLNHGTKILERLGELFDSGHGCDFNIAVVVDNETVETICTHKMILSLNQEILSSNVSNLALDITSVCQPHVTQFVRYLYTGKINVSLSSAQCFHKMASDWGLIELQEGARELFNWLLPEDSTFQSQAALYEYSVSTGDKVLQLTCLRYMAWNCEALIGSPAWTSLPLGTIKALLARSDLVVPSEAFILKGLERWEAAQGNVSKSEDQFDLLKYIRFPMISAEDLYRLTGKRYQAGKVEGFQFNALPIGHLFGELIRDWRPYTPRIYTGNPWSLTFSSQDVNTYKYQGSYYKNGQHYDSLSAHFQTPLHNSAYFTLFRKVSWSSRLYIKNHECSNNGVKCPALRLTEESSNHDLPTELQNGIIYQNKLLLLCEGSYVSHIQDLKSANNQNIALIPANISAGQAYPCQSDNFSYRLIVRPKYTTGMKFTEVEDDTYED